MKLKMIIPPTEEPLSLAEAKIHLKVDGSDEDLTLPGLIKQAREYCEGYQNKRYITQTLEAYLDNFPCGNIEFRECSPVQSITSITYTDKDGKDTIFDSANYSLDNVAFVNEVYLNYGKNWPSITLKPINGVKIRFIAGYGNAASVPETVKHAMILHMKVLHAAMFPEDQKLYEKRRDSLLGQRRVVPV
jgi:uncharacterized phiE125 gp8 family phage protein